jgi:hypothetical protein
MAVFQSVVGLTPHPVLALPVRLQLFFNFFFAPWNKGLLDDRLLKLSGIRLSHRHSVNSEQAC